MLAVVTLLVTKEIWGRETLKLSSHTCASLTTNCTPDMKWVPPAFIPSRQHSFSPFFRLHCLGF